MSVAREYLTSITIGKYNSRILPVTEASGALYCTWSELHEMAPSWAAFLQTLTFGQWCRWWLGMGALIGVLSAFLAKFSINRELNCPFYPKAKPRISPFIEICLF